MLKDGYTPMVSGRNGDDEASPLIDLNDVKDEKSKQIDMGKNIYFEAIVPTRKITFFVSTWLILLIYYS